MGNDIAWRFIECRLFAETAHAAHGGRAVCIFVNDHADRLCLEALRELGVKYIALRCAGFNGIDVAAAKQLGFSVTRVPASSPNAEAEQAVALLLALNRKIPRASNRVLDLNLSQGQDSRYRWHPERSGALPRRSCEASASRCWPSIRLNLPVGRGSMAWITPTAVHSRASAR